MEEVVQQLIAINLGSNNAWDYAQLVLWFTGLMIIFKIFKTILVKWLERLSKKTKSDLDDFLIQVVNELKPPFYLALALFISVKKIIVSSFFDKIIGAVLITVLIVQAILVSQRIIDFLLEKKLYAKLEETGGAENKVGAIKLLSQIAKVLLWVLGILMVLSNLGVDVSSLIAGLGIGGVAVAFALQGVLGDLFSSFMIFLDQPFKVGDQVQAGTDIGKVKKVGIRSSRITTLTGEELVVSNTDISNSRIRNLSRREKRRVLFNIGVTYGTNSKKLKEIPKIIEEIVSKEKHAVFKRAKFTTFGDSALIFEILYNVNIKDVEVFKEIQERINLDIYETFEKKKIEFAYPTQTIHINKG